MPNRVVLLAALLLLPACRIETRPPAGATRMQATVQMAVQEHYRVRNAQGADSVKLELVRQQVDLRRDLASVWATVRVRSTTGDSTVTSTRTEHLLLRRADDGWSVLTATPMSPP